MSDCALSAWKQCCCTCVFHIRDHYVCTPENHAKGICYSPKGWICVPPEGGPAISDWPQHSCGCELHTSKLLIIEAETELDHTEWNPDRVPWLNKYMKQIAKSEMVVLVDGEYFLVCKDRKYEPAWRQGDWVAWVHAHYPAESERS